MLFSKDFRLVLWMQGKAIEFDNGKTTIVVPSKDQLVATLDTFIGAVKA